MENFTKSKIIERFIREQIKKNIWLPGYKINTKEIENKFGVCSFTVRDAMLPLVSEGMLLRKPGLGTIIQKKETNIKGKVLIILPKEKPTLEENFPDKDIYCTYLCKELAKHSYDWKIVCYSEEFTKKNFIKTLMLDNSIFTKDIVGIINHIFFIPKNTFKHLKIPCVNISAFITKRECEIINSLGIIYFYGLNILSQYANNIAVFQYEINEQDPYSKKRKSIINREIQKFGNIKNILINPDNPNSAYEIFIDMTKNNPNINGVFVADPNLLLPIKRAIEKLKLDIPKDMKIICFTDKNGNYGIDLKWDRLEQNSQEIQKVAADLLIKKIQNKATDDKIIIYPKIIKGNSLK